MQYNKSEYSSCSENGSESEEQDSSSDEEVKKLASSRKRHRENASKVEFPYKLSY